ncbi:atypical/ABC1/ABC1-B protein kinase [Schizosaccharomyces cryophilus OY26]|uniref:Atypical/ABC1/ABC1-B protein kinase n=1 Tax=Schizosaccharomyces cryophilus (strain OY26 / ATCC MYA-4695 / CBS 11777 / NBRC 106824 / NRRL Y48691) TaxID=653667 RepID=S9VXG8_SCHCR|nr:atypical/ABC1/ABC1-B protein kinase [Schizosaccharomyces cryophilus OY26]EPY50869.1 atypical/ABC1/ABC1-B protein kinase [Schizosaccharomyces cryophilus OY26]
MFTRIGIRSPLASHNVKLLNVMRRGSSRRLYSKEPPTKQALSKRSSWTKRLVWMGSIGTGIYVWDRYYNAQALTRSIRTVYTATIVALDYKLNFNEQRADRIEALHERVAQRLVNMVSKNGGLYIKMGQIVAMQSSNLPPVYGRVFKGMFDDAPQIGWDEVSEIIKTQYNMPAEEVFATIEKNASASASIAQVHEAILPSGEKVAVKVQKPSVSKQMNWDLLVYRCMMYVYDKWIFHIPLYFTVDYVSERLRSEVNFIVEAEATRSSREAINQTDYLRGKVYVPKVYDKLSGEKIMITEWIDGIPLYNQQALSDAGFSKKQILSSLFNFLSFQMFNTKQVHCDPHPGNIVVRKVGRQPQVVILDHGLYVHESESFRKSFALLFSAAYTLDRATIMKVMHSWGIREPDLFANRMLNIPIDGDFKDESVLKSQEQLFEEQLTQKSRFVSFLQDCHRLPQELLMLGRCLMLIQKNNQMFGYPVNSLSILANVASRYVDEKPSPRWYQKLLSPIYWFFQHIMFPGDIRVPEIPD